MLLESLDDIAFEEESHVYSIGKKVYPSVTQAIRAAGMGDDFSMVPSHIMAYAQMRGRAVHLGCHYIDQGGVDMASVDERIRGYVEAYALFRSDCHVKVIASEQRIHTNNLANEGLWVAGTPDLLCYLNGRRSIVDRKTTQNLGRSAGYQTAGYALIWNTRHPRQLVTERYGLKLLPNGKYRLIPLDVPTDQHTFMDAIRFTHAQIRMNQWRIN